ncbi:MAG: AAA family ATPase [Prevotella sp.]|nr:AAA family ATPase [Prevotella sp.]
MDNIIDHIQIENYKSIRSLKMDDCKRINLLIGRPNVGKSNLLEAMSLFSVPYLYYVGQKSLRTLVRGRNTAELFFDGNMANPISVEFGEDFGIIIDRIGQEGISMEISLGKDEPFEVYEFSNDLKMGNVRGQQGGTIKVLMYKYDSTTPRASYGKSFLLPPSGVNLMETVKQLPLLKEEIGRLLASYDLKMVYDNASQELKAMKIRSDEIFLLPFTSLADSLQRMIFHKAAIQSNHNRVICLEEPEAHTFPPYIASVVQDVIDAKENQFFISTHSPYVTNALMESAFGDLAIFMFDMVDGETNVKRITSGDLQEIYDNGVDVFFNMETYL